MWSKHIEKWEGKCFEGFGNIIKTLEGRERISLLRSVSKTFHSEICRAPWMPDMSPGLWCLIESKQTSWDFFEVHKFYFNVWPRRMVTWDWLSGLNQAGELNVEVQRMQVTPPSYSKLVLVSDIKSYFSKKRKTVFFMFSIDTKYILFLSFMRYLMLRVVFFWYG